MYKEGYRFNKPERNKVNCWQMNNFQSVAMRKLYLVERYCRIGCEKIRNRSTHHAIPTFSRTTVLLRV